MDLLFAFSSEKQIPRAREGALPMTTTQTKDLAERYCKVVIPVSTCPSRSVARNDNWTKPLRGRNQVDVQFVSTGDPSGFQSTSCSLDKPLCRTMELLLAANPSDKGAFHDFSSPSHARRHADPQLGGEHPGVLRPADLTLRTLLSSVTRAVGTGADSCLPGLPDEGKEVGYRFDRHRHFRTSLPV